MRLLIVTTMNGYPWGGSEELWRATSLAAINAGHTVGIVAFKWPRRAAQIQELADRGAWLVERRRGMTGRLTTLQNRLADPFRGVEAFKPDLLYINQGGSFDLAGNSEGFRLCQLIDRLGVDYAIACHSINTMEVPEDEDRVIIRNRFAAARWVGFVAEAMIQTAQRQLAAPLANARVVRNPVNLHDLSPVGWPRGPAARFAFVGRLEPRKGLDLLLQALSSPLWNERDWSLDVFGDGPRRNYYEELIGYFGLSDRVRLVGHQADVREIWREHHLLLLTSHYEGMPLAVVEAMLLARPVVATDVGGTREWVLEGETGFLADAPTVRSIQAAMERAWTHRDRWEAMSKSARALATKQYDPTPGQTILKMLLEPRNSDNQGSR